MYNFSKFMVFFISSCVLHNVTLADFPNKHLRQLKTKSVSQKVKRTQKININQASAQAIAKSFKGIGKKRSAAIVAYRKENGAFKSLNELSKVAGISKRFVEKNAVRLQKTFSL